MKNTIIATGSFSIADWGVTINNPTIGLIEDAFKNHYSESDVISVDVTGEDKDHELMVEILYNESSVCRVFMVRTTVYENNFELSESLHYNTYGFEWDCFVNDHKHLILGDWNNNDYLVIGDIDAPAFKVTHLRALSKSEIVDMWYQYECGYNADQYNKAELISDLMEVDMEQYHKYIHENVRWNDIECDFVCRGNHQGDAMRVVLLEDAEEYLDQKHLENILYNSPIMGMIEFTNNGDTLEELYYDEFMDQWEIYDKDEFIKVVEATLKSEYKDMIVQMMKDQLPTELDYS